MAKKKSEVESTEATTAVAEASAPGTDKPKAKRGRGRPKGSKSATKVPNKTKGKRGRPKGSKNKKSSLTGGSNTGGLAMKRGRGRPPGSGKKAAVSASGLRGIITQIVRDEVHAALLQAFKGL